MRRTAIKLCFEIRLAPLHRGVRPHQRGAPARQEAGTRGRAVQVDPIKHTLKAPGPQRLKLEYDGLLSNFAFKFNWRRYIKGELEGAPDLTKEQVKSLFNKLTERANVKASFDFTLRPAGAYTRPLFSTT
jgi:hypothetical protein